VPTIVDHDVRRLEIAGAVGKLVARGGIQAVTVRAAAKEAGYSTAVISHYFHNKEDLMNFTYLSARDRTNSRVDRARLAGKSVFDCLKECLPTNPSQRADWTVWFGLWGMATGNPALERERSKGLSEANSLFVQVLEAARQRGELAESFDCTAQAERLLVFVNGIATLWVQMPERWPAKAQLDLLRSELQSIGAL
jgi:TetR/AcrR family transcriptional regulator, transcriptional repressor of bet genes